MYLYMLTKQISILIANAAIEYMWDKISSKPAHAIFGN